ncbi:uL30 family ribosomal protein [Candidatus Pacearchaeota archaeon]|nr:uL30 family ribosomal protein [Candidatus Pacearchaeota archaeon]
MIAIIRIKGLVKIKEPLQKTLYNLRLRRKYVCVIISETKENMGMIKKISSFVAFGQVNKETLEKLIEKRGKLIDKNKKIDAKKAAEEIIKGIKCEKVNLKPFFRLHPPRGGIKSKVAFPKGVLGNHGEKINDLIMRML